MRSVVLAALVVAMLPCTACQAILGIGETSLAADASMTMPADGAAPTDAVLAATDAVVDAPLGIVDARLGAADAMVGAVDATVDAADAPLGAGDAAQAVDASGSGPFAITLAPMNAKVVRGSFVMIAVTLARQAGFDGEVDVMVENLPAGVATTTASFAGQTVSLNVTISAATNATLGAATAMMHASAGSMSIDVPLALLVADPAGTPDMTFGGGGVVTPSLPGANTVGLAGVILESDGDIVVGGSTILADQPTWVIGRVGPTGKLDLAFGPFELGSNSGGGTDPFVIAGLAAQSDDSILAVGTVNAHLTVMRVKANGIVDDTFGSQGQSTAATALTAPSYGYAVVEQPMSHGIIAVGKGDSDIATLGVVCRFLPGGGLDTSFAAGVDGGCVTTSSTASLDSVIAFADDSMVVAGGGFIWRLHADGTTDTLYGASGVVNQTLAIAALGAQSTGAVVSCGEVGTTSVVGMSRVGPTGGPDGTFSFMAGPLDLAGIPTAMAVNSDDSIVVTATGFDQSTPDVAKAILFRTTPTGGLDPMFGSGGIVSAPGETGNGWKLNAVAIEPDGRIVVVGSDPSGSPAILRLWQ